MSAQPDPALDPLGLDEQRPAAGAAATAPSNKVADWGFINDLKKLKELRSFLVNEVINDSPQDSAPLSFGALNTRLQHFVSNYDPQSTCGSSPNFLR
jgi:hypothetical protein